MIQDVIEAKLTEEFRPDYLQVLNESYMHNVPTGSESHFKVVIASCFFEGKRLIEQHRAVNQVLAEELAECVHALSIHTYTPEQWSKNQLAPDSPMCFGGRLKD
jgi:BolA protein